MNQLKSFWASIVRTWQGSKRGKVGIGCAALFVFCAVCAVCAQILNLTQPSEPGARATVPAVAIVASATPTERANLEASPEAGPALTLAPTESPAPTGLPSPTNSPAPTSTPGPTEALVSTHTPGPTDTPAPTNTPAPPTETPLPTNTPSPADALRDLARAQFGDELIESRIADVLGKNYATVDYDLGLQWDEGSAVFSTQFDFIQFAPKVFALAGVDALELRAFTDFKDALGNTKSDVAIKFTLQRDLAERINWEGVEQRRLGDALNSDEGNGVYVHPALRAAWDESQE